MTSKMSMLREDSIVGYNKRVVNYTTSDAVKQLSFEQVNNYDSDQEDEDDFYDHYEPYEEDFDDGDYQPFDPEEEEKEHQAQISPKLTKTVKPLVWINSPNKSEEKSPDKSPSPTWWDKNETIDESKRLVNGVLNYAALLPAPTPKKQTELPPIFPPKNKSRKNKKHKDSGNVQTEEKKFKKQLTTTDKVVEIQKPTRFCLSVIKKSKCFHGTRCRFAHDYADLKECNFGDKCKKIVLIKTNSDGTIELSNRNEVTCNFKHAKESKNSYLKRVPQQHTSPKK